MFLFTGVGTTHALMLELTTEHRPRVWRDSYEAVLPYVRDAFSRVVTRLEAELPAEFRRELIARFRELCEPDPRLRGHPRTRAALGSSYSLERYVASFNLVAQRAEARF